MSHPIRFLVAVTFFHCSFWSHAQNYSVYNHYITNPYPYNPAEAASDYAYFFVNHRMQWMGIEGAPVYTTANFHTLIDKTRIGIGLKASSFKRGLLNTSDFAFTYAYGIPMNEKNTLFLGLSGGAITNSIDLTEADPDDPAVAHYLTDNIQPIANFGLLLKSQSGLHFGIALPQLFAPKFNSLSSFQHLEVSPLGNLIISAYYKKKMQGRLVSRRRHGVRRKVKTGERYAPLEFYTLYKFAQAGNSQFEGTVKLNLSDHFFLASSYRLGYGLTGSLGFSMGSFMLSYSYEPGNQPEPVFSRGTHEMQLGLRLGEAKRFKKKITPVLRSTLKPGATQHHTARFHHTEDEPDSASQQPTAKKMHYVVIRSFDDFTAADEFKQKLIAQKFNADIFYYDRDKKYHVHVLQTTKGHEAHDEARNLKNFTKLKSAHVLSVPVKPGG